MEGTGRKEKTGASGLVTEARYQRILHFLTTRQDTLRLFLDDVKNTHNISAVIRSCDATGIFYLYYYLSEHALSVNRGISLGSERWIQKKRVRNRTAFLEEMKQKGFQCLVTFPGDSAVDYRSVDYTRPSLIVFGNEREGISQTVAQQADQLIKIPMVGMVKSLNISVACAVILYEAFRQREGRGMYRSPSLPRNVFDTFLRRWTVEDRLSKAKASAINAPLPESYRSV